MAKQPLRYSGFPFYSCNFVLFLSWVCLTQSDLSLSNLQLYSRPNIGVGMLGWAVYVSHNKASHKGVALSLTSSHLTARHGQVVCMETRLCACVCISVCVCVVPGEAERLLPPPISMLYLESFSEIRLLSPPLSVTLTLTVFVSLFHAVLKVNAVSVSPDF